MLSEQTLKEILKKGSTNADISIIEGVMGLFDGKNPTTNEGSTAEISIITESPVILVVDCSALARSSAAIVKGFQSLDERVHIAGVIANRVGSVGHYELVKTAIEQECRVPVIGYLQREQHFEIPERRLGLIPAVERGELNSIFQNLGERISATIDLQKLYEVAQTNPVQVEESHLFTPKRDRLVRMAVARDEAFHFYYPENLELLEAYGAEIVEFSPMRGEVLPEGVDGLYFGGGLPEQFARPLSEQQDVKDSIRKAIENGLPTLVECGGFMYLARSVQKTGADDSKTEERYYPMVGIIPGRIRLQSRLAALGYREVTGEKGNFLLGEEDKAKGHEYHYATFTPEEELAPAYETKGMRGSGKEGFVYQNLVAGLTQLHFASCPALVERWIDKCVQYKLGRLASNEKPTFKKI